MGCFMRPFIKGLAALAVIFPTTTMAADCGQYEAIEPGDNLSGIAARCDTSIDALSAANPDIDALDLQIGSVLRLTSDTANTAVPTTYRELIGSWSEDGICIGKEIIATLDVNYIEFGETQCTLEDVQTTQGSFLLLVTECISEGEPTANQTVQITPRPDGAIDYFGVGSFRLERCRDL